eukprot:4028230-Amphidinium_carterae.1
MIFRAVTYDVPSVPYDLPDFAVYTCCFPNHCICSVIQKVDHKALESVSYDTLVAGNFCTNRLMIYPNFGKIILKPSKP